MKFTNVYNLPDSLFKALAHDDYELRGDISVTGLIKPPRIKQLEERFSSQIIEDISERVWLLLGKSVHVVLQLASKNTLIAERSVELDVMDWKVTGTLDLLENYTLIDYKVSSVWSVIYGLKPEWEAQLNLYRLLAGQPLAEHLQIIAILRDHQKSKAKTDSNYPQIPIGILNVPVWPAASAHDYLCDRVKAHQKAATTMDDVLPYCTSEERWARPTTYAVKKKGRKTALRVLNSMEEAKAWMATTDKGDSVEERLGASIRCEDYCLVKKFCNQYQEMTDGK